MDADNSSYTVTAPDLFLSDNGVNVLISSTDKMFIDDVKDMFELYVQNSIVFNVQDRVTNKTSLPWMWHVSRTCEYMILDIDTCAWEDIMAALLKTRDENHIVIFFSAKQKRREAIRLINATSKFIIFTRLTELNTFLGLDTQAYSALDD